MEGLYWAVAVTVTVGHSCRIKLPKSITCLLGEYRTKRFMTSVLCL